MPDKPVKKALWLVKIFISVGILFLLTRNIPLENVVAILRHASLSLILGGLLVVLIAHYLNSIQMYLLIQVQAIRLNSVQILGINLITQFYGLFLPGSLSGGAIRWYLYAKPDKKPAEALAAMILNRILDFILILGLGIFFWLLDAQAISNTYGVIGFIILFFLMAFAYLLSFNSRAHSIIERALNLRFCPRIITEKGMKLLLALQQYERLSASFHFKIITLGVFRHLLVVASIYCFALALEMSIDYTRLGWIRSVVTLVLFLPITIAGIGVREASFIYLLYPYGVAPALALGLSLLVFSQWIVFGIIGALLEFKRVFIDKPEEFRE